MIMPKECIPGGGVQNALREAGFDYENCLVNLSNSVLKNFGAEATANTLPIADAYLAKGYRNVVVILLDALGLSALETHLDQEGFFRSHLKHRYSSVYPPTTVAATVSFLSGLYPNEHGWLGWDMYFPELDKNVTVFWNQEQLAEKEDARPAIDQAGKDPIWTPDSLQEVKKAADFDVASTHLPYTNIIEKINAAHGDACAYAAMPYLDPYPDTLDKVLERVKTLCHEPGKKFIYSYWNEPDATMHRSGTTSDETHEMLVSIEKKVKEAVSTLSDTLVFITADHGHIDSRNLCILEEPEVMNCLVRMPSIEPRTLNFFVRAECIEGFPELFRRKFGKDFLLLTKEEVLTGKLFGPGQDREGLRDRIGDFVALAISNASIFPTHYAAQKTTGVHAGLTVEEAGIPLIVVET